MSEYDVVVVGAGPGRVVGGLDRLDRIGHLSSRMWRSMTDTVFAAKEPLCDVSVPLCLCGETAMCDGCDGFVIALRLCVFALATGRISGSFSF